MASRIGTVDERKTTGASYIVSFYQDIDYTVAQAVTYNNLMLELEAKYGEENVNKCSEMEKEKLKENMQLLRYHVQRAYIKYISILSVIKKEPNEILESKYLKIKKNFVIDRDDVDSYIIQINKFLVTEIMGELLETSQSLVGALYDGELK